MLDRVVAAIHANRYRYANEGDLQQGLAVALERSGLTPAREVRLSPRDRIDLLVDGVGIEVKVASSTASVLRQLTRYAASDRLQCEEGCWWVEPDLCSACADPEAVPA